MFIAFWRGIANAATPVFMTLSAIFTTSLTFLIRICLEWCWSRGSEYSSSPFGLDTRVDKQILTTVAGASAAGAVLVQQCLCDALHAPS